MLQFLCTASDAATTDMLLWSVIMGARFRSLRQMCNWQVVPTPLTRLRWWRVCLDEAQMVESSTAKAAEMALKLDAQHRWAVTGTPLSRGLEDLFGLLVRCRSL